jgi:hypothetical protein
LTSWAFTFRLEFFFRSVASFIDASVLTVYTADGIMHFYIHYTEPSTSTAEIDKLVSKAMDLLRSAIERPINA